MWSELMWLKNGQSRWVVKSAVLNLRVPLKLGTFLVTLKATDYSRRLDSTMLDGQTHI
jgi:hypothetical protein